MTIFDFFERNQEPNAKPARHARKSPRRILGAHFEWLEPRCLMSVAPPAPILVEPENAQYAYFYAAPLVQSNGGHYPSAPQPGQQLQFQPIDDAPSGIVIVRGMTDIGPLSLNSAQGVPNAIADGIFFNHEFRAVQEMLSSLQYIPASSPAEITQQPTLVPSAPTTAPTFPTIAPPWPSKSPSSSGNSPSLPSSAPSLLRSSPVLPASTASSPSGPPSIFSSEPSASVSDAPTSESPHALGRHDALGRQRAQHDSEGGMVSLVRQPIAQASAVDKISIAAIDAFLEIPAKVGGMQGRFQAFEISVITEPRLPVAPPPAEAQIHLPVASPHAITTPATDSNLPGAWVPSDSACPIPPLNLSAEEFSSAAFFNVAFLNEAAPLAENALPFAELPPAASDAVFGELSPDATDNPFSSPRLDMAAATLLAVVIGRALWPARASKTGGQEKTASSREAE